MSVKITDLGAIVPPLAGTEVLEIVQDGLSRKVTVDELGAAAPGLDATFVTISANPDLVNERVLTAGAGINIVDGGAGNPVTISAIGGGQVDSVVGGVNITVNAGDPVNPIVDLDAAITGMTVNGVVLNAVGAATNYLDESGAYSVPPAGGTPGGADTNIQYNNAGAFAGDANLVWDDVAKTMTISKTGGSGAALSVTNLLANTPIIQTGGVGSSSTSSIPMRMMDQSTQFFQFFMDISLSSGNHKLEIQSSSVGVTPFIEFDNSGEMALFGTQGSNALLFTGLGATLKMKASVPLYFEKLAAAGADDVNEGQFWVRDTLDNEPMFIDGLGVDSVLNAAASIPDPLIIGSINVTSALAPATGAPYGNVPINIGANLSGTMPMTQLTRQNIQTYPSGFSFGSTLFVNINGGDVILGDLNGANLTVNDGIAVEIQHAGSGNVIVQSVTNGLQFPIDGTLFMDERAAAAGTIGNNGQFWVRSDVPNVPMFTNDVGTDFVLNAAASFTPPLVLLDNEQIEWGTGNDMQMSFDGTNFLFESAAGFPEFQLRDGIEFKIFDTTNAHFIELRSNGTNANFSVNTGKINVLSTFSFTDNTECEFGASDEFRIFSDGTDGRIIGVGPANLLLTGFDQFRIDMPLGMNESATPDVNLAGVGQYWVRSSAPNRPTFTDDTDVDQLLDPSISEIISVVASRVGILTDKGKTVAFTGATAAQTMTIPASGSVAYQIGTVLAWDNSGSVSFTIAITTDTLIFADNNGTGSRVLAAGGYAAAQKVGATTWKISGANIT